MKSNRVGTAGANSSPGGHADQAVEPAGPVAGDFAVKHRGSCSEGCHEGLLASLLSCFGCNLESIGIGHGERCQVGGFGAIEHTERSRRWGGRLTLYYRAVVAGGGGFEVLGRHLWGLLAVV